MAQTLTPAERRARREERRERQRAQNVIRARRMHIERLAASRGAVGSESIARSSLSASWLPKLNVGCSGWYYWHWGGAFYPAALPRTSWFEHYAKHFETVELNAPFYSWPTLATVATWKRQPGRRRFVYAIKVNELITHTKRFARTDALVKDFGLIADLLGARFGCFLFQLPPSFRYSSAALARILRQLEPQRRNVVEFRHASWWNERVFSAFEAHGAIFCSVSAPRLPEELVKTTDEVYLRFHGTQRWYRHDYASAELAVWTRRIRESGAQRVWAYFNNDREGYAIENARELMRQLRAPA